MTNETAARVRAVRRTAGKAVINVAVPVTALIAALNWAASHGVGMFVFRTDFNDYVAAQKFTHTTDSLIYDAKLNAVSRDVTALVRACQRRRECP